MSNGYKELRTIDVARSRNVRENMLRLDMSRYKREQSTDSTGTMSPNVGSDIRKTTPRSFSNIIEYLRKFAHISNIPNFLRFARPPTYYAKNDTNLRKMFVNIHAVCVNFHMRHA
jgi:hypothetical protein